MENMSIHWVPGVLRAAGLTVVEHDGWQNRSNGSLADDYWVWHHDASARGDSPGVPDYMIRNFRNAGAQLWVDRQGRWHIIAAGRAAHAGKVLPGKPGNSNSIGIETDHTTGEDWPPALLNSLRRGTAAMMKYRGKNENHLEFHKTICSPPGRKVDPAGLDLGHERAQVRAILNQSTAVQGNTSIPEDDDMPTPAEVANAVLNTPDPALGGQTVHQVLASLSREVASVPQSVLFGNRVEGRNLIDQHIQTRAEIAGLKAALSTLATAQGVDPEKIEQAVRDGVAGALDDVQTTITIKEKA